MKTREHIKNKKRIVIKIGSSSLTHEQTGDIHLGKIEKLARQIADLRGMGKEVVLVSSGAIAAGKQALGYAKRPQELAKKQAFAAVGQARLMMIYQRIFAEYNLTTAQVLMTKHTVVDAQARYNAKNTFVELLKLGTIPIVNENDTISTYEIRVGDNDRLSALVASLIGADLLLMLSDIDGLYTDDPRINKNAKFIDYIPIIEDSMMRMGKDTTSLVGTGGMYAKLIAGKIVMDAGCDMIIANGENFDIIYDIIGGQNKGSLFQGNPIANYDICKYLESEEE